MLRHPRGHIEVADLHPVTACTALAAHSPVVPSTTGDNFQIVSFESKSMTIVMMKCLAIPGQVGQLIFNTKASSC